MTIATIANAASLSREGRTTCGQATSATDHGKGYDMSEAATGAPLIHDILVAVPIGSEDVLEHQAQVLGNARVIHNPDDPEELFYTPASDDDDGGWAVVRVRNASDPQAVARELQRRVMGLRIVGVYKRTS
jgi:hypothetical protein